jgi:two-component system, NarL family, response regulator NreC
VNNKIHLGLVEDQVLFREGIKAILSVWPEIEIVFESAEGYTVIERLKECEILPQVMLVDLSLPPQGQTEYSGKDLTLALREHFPDIKIIILSGNDDENFISQLIENGANGYLVKSSDPSEVYEAINSVHTRGSYINLRALMAIQKNAGKKPKKNMSNFQLTPREIEILQLVCQQLTTEDIADKLFLSPKTVNGHRNNLLSKTGAKNTAGLVIFAIKNEIYKV